MPFTPDIRPFFDAVLQDVFPEPGKEKKEQIVEDKECDKNRLAAPPSTGGPVIRADDPVEKEKEEDKCRLGSEKQVIEIGSA